MGQTIINWPWNNDNAGIGFGVIDAGRRREGLLRQDIGGRDGNRRHARGTARGRAEKRCGQREDDGGRNRQGIHSDRLERRIAISFTRRFGPRAGGKGVLLDFAHPQDNRVDGAPGGQTRRYSCISHTHYDTRPGDFLGGFRRYICNP